MNGGVQFWPAIHNAAKPDCSARRGGAEQTSYRVHVCIRSWLVLPQPTKRETGERKAIGSGTVSSFIEQSDGVAVHFD